MKNSSPKKGRSSPKREGRASPAKSRPSTSIMEDDPRENAELQHQMREMDAENEHVKNMLIGLNEKLTVFNDLKVDVENHKAMLQ